MTSVPLTIAPGAGIPSQMTEGLACVLCTIDPQTTSLVVPMAQATVIAVPFFFRDRIASAVRRARRGAANAAPDEGCDTPADDGADQSEPPGALRP
jgi:hypothetical protein